MRKKLILVASPPACGKTYVSELIAKSVEHIVYLDKDDLSDLIRATFDVSGEKFDMDGEFYKNNIRHAEYSAIMNIAFSSLRFEQHVLLNAPLAKEVRDLEYMMELKRRANKNGADLLLIWVIASPTLCFERMKKRNSDRDTLKLENWEEYVSKINYAPPFEIEKSKAVDNFIVFDTNDDMVFQKSMKKTIDIILGE